MKDWVPSLNEVQKLLAALYDVDSIPRVMTQAGVGSSWLPGGASSDAPREYWYKVLMQLHRTRGVVAVIDFVAGENEGRRVELEAVRAAYVRETGTEVVVDLDDINDILQEQEGRGTDRSNRRGNGDIRIGAPRRPEEPVYLPTHPVERLADRKRSDLLRAARSALLEPVEVLRPADALSLLADFEATLQAGEVSRDHLAQLVEYTIGIELAIEDMAPSDRQDWSSVFGELGLTYQRVGQVLGPPYSQVMELAEVYWQLELEAAGAAAKAAAKHRVSAANAQRKDREPPPDVGFRATAPPADFTHVRARLG